MVVHKWDSLVYTEEQDYYYLTKNYFYLKRVPPKTIIFDNNMLGAMQINDPFQIGNLNQSKSIIDPDATSKFSAPQKERETLPRRSNFL